MTDKLADTCVACGCHLPAERTIVRRADGAVRFVMCNECFDRRYCELCVAYFPSVKARQEHRCPN